MVVMKFGGSSVGDGQRIRNVAGIVGAFAEREGTPAVVVSAMQGVTDALIRAAEAASRRENGLLHRAIAELYARHE